MSLRVALVIDGEQAGAKKALDDTATGITKVQEAAGRAADPVKQVGEGLKQTASEAGKAGAALADVADAAEQSGGKFTTLKTLAISAIGGIAGAFAVAGLEAVISSASGAFIDFTENILSSAPQIRDALSEHETLIKAIKGAYAEADGAASTYGNNSVALLTFQAQQNIQRLREGLERGQNELVQGNSLQQGLLLGAPGLTSLLGDPRFGAGTEGTDFAEPVKRFREELASGKADVIAFRNEIADLASGLSIDDSEGRGLAEKLLGDTESLANVQVELQRAGDLYRALTGDADAAANALGGSADKFTEIGGTLPGLNDSLAETDRLLASIGSRPQPGAGSVSVANPDLNLGFASGGWTGNVPTHKVAGFVHGQEYVFDAAATARIGVDNLEAIRRGVAGYATGGYVGGGYVGSYAGSYYGGNSREIGTVGNELAAALQPLRGILADMVIGASKAKNVWDIVGGYAERLYENVLSTALGTIEDAFINLVSGSFSKGGGGGGGLGDLVGGFFSSIFGGGGSTLRLGYQAGVLHTGGSVARPPASRFVPAALFDNAPRLHSGGSLRAGERPIIALDGEDVGFPEQLSAKYGGKTEVHIHPTAGQTATVRESDKGGKRRIDVTLNEAVGRAIATPRGPSQQALAVAGSLAFG